VNLLKELDLVQVVIEGRCMKSGGASIDSNHWPLAGNVIKSHTPRSDERKMGRVVNCHALNLLNIARNNSAFPNLPSIAVICRGFFDTFAVGIMILERSDEGESTMRPLCSARGSAWPACCDYFRMADGIARLPVTEEVVGSSPGFKPDLSANPSIRTR